MFFPLLVKSEPYQGTRVKTPKRINSISHKKRKEHGGRDCITSSKTSTACYSVSASDSRRAVARRGCLRRQAARAQRRNVREGASLDIPNIEYVLWAILIGLAISNTVGVPQIFRSGVAT